MDSVIPELREITVGMVCLLCAVWGLRWKELNGCGYNYVKTHSDVWLLSWMTPRLGSDGTIALRTYAWPLHVVWASSQHGSFRVPGLFT